MVVLNKFDFQSLPSPSLSNILAILFLIPTPLGETQNDPNVEWISGDATAPGLIQKLVDDRPDINACFHCIGQCGDPYPCFHCLGAEIPTGCK